MRLLFSIVALLASVIAADARGGGGGHVTTFDPGSYNGGWSCYRSLASGTCGAGPFANYFNATCNGIASDAAAQNAWLAYGQSLGVAQAKLYIPPGSRCVSGGGAGLDNNSFCADRTAHDVDSRIQNCLIWAYGASIDNFATGGHGFYNDGTHNALIQQAVPGDTKVTLIDKANASKFPVGRWICITALSLQTFGFPPNWQFFDYRLVTAVNAGTGEITLNSPLTNTYKITYPIVPGVGEIDLGGPASIYIVEPTWNIISQVFGLAITNTPQVVVIGRSVVVQDVVLAAGGFDPTSSVSISFVGSELGSPELDKMVENLALINTTSGQLIIQSASIRNLTIWGGSARQFINGLPLNTMISKFKTPAIKAGPWGYGHANSVALNNVTFTTALTEGHDTPSSIYSYLNGTFTVLKSDPNYFSALSVFVPGYKYYFADSQGFNDCIPPVPFAVTDIVDAGSSVQILTDLPNTLPTPTCGGIGPATNYSAYQTNSAVQAFSGPGNLASNPEFIAP